MMATDQNGEVLQANLRQHADGTWGVNVRFGVFNVTVKRRYYYRTLAEATAADVSDENWVAMGVYMHNVGNL